LENISKEYKSLVIKPIIPFTSLESTKNNCEEHYDVENRYDYDIEDDFDVQKLVAEWRDWVEFTNNRVLVFRSLEDDKRVMVLDWNHRWKPSYMRSVKKRFGVIADLCESYNFVHIVLTVERHGLCRGVCHGVHYGVHYSEIGYCMRKLKATWKYLHDLLMKRYGKFMYVAVLEPHKNGYPHLHILIFCDFYLIKQKELSRYVESKGAGRICFIKRYWANRYGRKPIYYLTKYLSKYWNRSEWSDSFMVFSAYLRKTRTRSIMFSRGFGQVIVKEKREKRWELWFTCDRDEVEYLLNLGNVKLNDGG